jgi:hypothetical protein
MTDDEHHTCSRRQVIVLAVVALPLVAGCSALGVGDSDPTGQTLTPVDVSRETTVVSVAQPESSSETGAETDENRSLDRRILARLTSVYDEQLSNTSYRVTVRLTFVVDGSTVGVSELERRVAPGPQTRAESRGRTHVETFRTRGVLAPSNASFTSVAFENESLRATRYTDERNSDPRYQIVRRGLPVVSDLDERSRLEQLLLAYELEPARSSADDAFALRSERIKFPSVLLTPSTATAGSRGTLSVRIGASNTVDARAVYNLTVGENSTAYMIQTYRLDRVGNVTVQPPPWISVASAREETETKPRPSRDARRVPTSSKTLTGN